MDPVLGESSNSWIPVVDLTEVAITLDDNQIEKSSLEKCGDQIADALSGIGFVYLRNHGIPIEQIKEAFRMSSEFFSLDPETKRNYKAKSFKEMNHGFLEIGFEKLDKQYEEIRESFNVNFLQGFTFPSEVEGFKEMIEGFFEDCSKLGQRLLTLMAVGLKLEDKYALRNGHRKGFDSAENDSTLRLLYYPPVVKKGNITRCGEHSDYGSITLLFQDAAGGLQVKRRDGDFMDAIPIEGTVLLNIGDLMQRWTADKLVSTRHRVLMPDCEEKQKKPRYSIAFFVSPDFDAVVECVDKSNKYPPINAHDYLNMRFEETF